MSESSGAATQNSPFTNRWASIGYAPLGIEVKVFNTMELKDKGLLPVPPAKDLSQPAENEQGELCFRYGVATKIVLATR